MQNVILDTDIGSDVDDALALAVLLGAKNLNLHSITTVYGDTSLRAKIAAALCRHVGRDIPIFAGASTPLSGKAVWTSGREGANFDALDHLSISTLSANDHLLGSVEDLPDLHIVAIGPLTNIAHALMRSPIFEKRVKALWIMGGNFSSHKPEHNFSCDSAAAEVVFKSSIPTFIVDLPTSQQTNLNKSDIERIERAGKLGPTLFKEIKSWIEPRGQDWTTPHDPLLALALVEPEQFTQSRAGFVSITGDGTSTWSENKAGNVRLLSPRNPSLAVEAMISYIEQV